MYKGYTGYFKPRNIKKYKGDVNNIIFRSLLERNVMKFFDDHSNIIEWSSEEVVIPYFNPLDNAWHRYFVDFSCVLRTSDNKTKKLLIEVKPEKFTKQPTKPKRQTRQYLSEVTMYITNKHKWDAAEEWCKKNGYEFKILTEKNIRSRNK